jgi:hypothetical protein
MTERLSHYLNGSASSRLAPGHDRNSRFIWANWLVLVLGGGLLILNVIGSLAGPS